jgi:hypothetical protein
LPPKAHIRERGWHVRLGPVATVSQISVLDS